MQGFLAQKALHNSVLVLWFWR